METGVQNREMDNKGHRDHKNRLASEKSPYLLQHATNPVDWFTWGDEAFHLARKEDKPVFLSIGYSTCHWCHVMERESFEDEEVARLLNQDFISIKVDREERPDIDHIYMNVAHLLTGSGGWPLTIIMTPDKEPFFAGTYIPKTSHFNRPGMTSLLPAISEAWKSKRTSILDSSQKISRALSEISSSAQGEEPGEKALHRGYFELAERFDHEYGGFGHGMKFPTPHQLIFLLRYWNRTGQEGALEIAEKTLLAMRKGGIFDHVGYGFHRYSTDRKWLVPHFEKMLYDQALLLFAYTEAFLATQKPFYKRVAEEIGQYVLRDMTSPEGGFYSAEDADSEGEEGKFYVFNPPEIRELLGKEDSKLVIEHFGVTDKGNFEEESTGRYTGNNILHEKVSLSELENQFDLTEKELADRLEISRNQLLAARDKRVRPLLDDKILVDWNGLMIGALSMAGRAFDDQSFIDGAKNAANFINASLLDEKGRLLHRYRGGEAGIPGYLDDYAFLSFGLMELYQATFDAKYLKEASRLSDLLIDLFADEKGGGFFLNARDSEQLLVRPKEHYDGAIPSGNSVAFYNLARLSRVTENSSTNEILGSTAKSFHSDIEKQSSSHSFFLTALDFVLGPSIEIVIAGDPESHDTKTLTRGLKANYSPNKFVLLSSNKDNKELVSIAPFVASQVMLDGKATAYVCVEQSCSFPTTDLKTMLDNIKEKSELERGNR